MCMRWRARPAALRQASRDATGPVCFGAISDTKPWCVVLQHMNGQLITTSSPSSEFSSDEFANCNAVWPDVIRNVGSTLRVAQCEDGSKTS